MSKKGYKQSKEHIAKRVAKQLGQKRTKEQIKRISLAHKGQVGYWLGKKRSLETRKRLSKVNKGKHHSPATEFKKGINKGYEILGGEKEYRKLHYWVEKKLGKPTKCEKCGRDNLIGKQIHWANKSGKYKKDINDWIRLCAKCHFYEDKRNKLMKG